jgi:hypothetical protein
LVGLSTIWPGLDTLEQLFDTGCVDRQPVEHVPDQWRGELDGLHIRYDGDPIPVTVRVQWTDGTRGRGQRVDKPVDQVTRLRLPRDRAAISPVLGASLRRPPTGDGRLILQP